MNAWQWLMLAGCFAACAPTLDDTGMIVAGGHGECPDGFVARYGRCCPMTATAGECPSAGIAGSACSANEPCVSTATYMALCIHDVSGAADQHFVHGYCSAACTTDAQCQDGAACVNNGCVRTCTTANAPCPGAPGTYCYPSPVHNICFPDCAQGGATCTNGAVCLSQRHQCARSCDLGSGTVLCPTGTTCTMTESGHYCL